MTLLDWVETALNRFADFMWGTPTVILLVGGGLLLTVYSRLRAFRYFPHAIALILGRYNRADDPGHGTNSGVYRACHSRQGVAPLAAAER